MKRLVFFLLSSSFIVSTISAQKPASFIPEEYEYPYEKIGKGITKVFQIVETSTQIFINLKTYTAPGKNYLFKSHYFNGKIVDSSVIVNNKIDEVFVFTNNSSIKESIVVDTIIRNGGKYGKRLFRAEHILDGFTISHLVIEEYVKDTSISWKGKLVDCIEDRVTTLDLFKSQSSSLLNLQKRANYMFYFAKGIGMIRYTVEGNNKLYNIVLQEVIDYK